MATALYSPGLAVTVSNLESSSALGGETSDTVASAWTALGKTRGPIAVIATATNIAVGQIVTLAVNLATDSAGTGSTAVTGTGNTTLTATGTATATDLFEMVWEYEGGFATAYTHIQAALTTDNASGAEVVSMILVRKLSS